MRHVFTNATAAVTEVGLNISVGDVYLVSNDEASGGADLWLGFYGSTATDTNYMVIKPGEQFENLSMECVTLYYRSSASTVSFRVYGKKN